MLEGDCIHILKREKYKVLQEKNTNLNIFQNKKVLKKSNETKFM